VEEAHHTWFFIGDKGLPHPVLLGKDFLFPRERPPRVFAVLVNVLNTPSKKDKMEKMEAERRHRALVRDNEKAKEGRMAVMQTYGARSETRSETSSGKSIVVERS
jgi:predicted solute-binding protein